MGEVGDRAKTRHIESCMDDNEQLAEAVSVEDAHEAHMQSFSLSFSRSCCVFFVSQLLVRSPALTH